MIGPAEEAWETYESLLCVCEEAEEDALDDRDEERRKDVRMWEKEFVKLEKREVCMMKRCCLSDACRAVVG